jgi:class 3 adenylate cyclase
VGIGLFIAYVIGKKTWREQREFERNRLRLQARNIVADDMTMNRAMINVADPVGPSLSQPELAAMIRENLKARADEATNIPVKVSPMRELGAVMKDLTSTIKEANRKGALVPRHGAAHEHAGAASDISPARELATIMLTDMVGYSGAMEVNEQLTYEKLLAHNQIVRTTIANYRGREIKTIGDAFLVIFRSALDAVDCALAIQRAFGEFNAAKDEPNRILLRIGIHLGDILITQNDVFGEAVNILSRIQPLAQPGGICVSEAVFIHVRKKFELKVERIGSADLKLKNIAVAPDVYRLNMD